MSKEKALALHDFFGQFELQMVLKRRFRVALHARKQREKAWKEYLNEIYRRGDR